MPVIFGPADVLITSGYDQPPVVLAFGTLNPQETITWSATGSSPAPGNTQNEYHYELWTQNRALGPLALFQPPFGQPVSHSFTASGVTTFQVEVLQGGLRLPSPTGTVFGAAVEKTVVTNTPCIYGTELQPGAAAFQILTLPFLEALFAEFGAPFIVQLLTGILFQTVDLTALCGELPPSLPPVDRIKPGLSFQDQLQIVHAVLWSKVCKCRDGVPAPLPPPTPTPPPNPGVPSPIVFPCDNVDPCAALVQIQRQLAAISATVGADLQLDTLVQRYSLPFAYINGAMHRDVAVTQSFPVSRLIGVKVIVTQAPALLERFSGLPQYIADLGWLSLVTADGLIDEIRLTRQEQVWTPRLMPLAVAFGITVREGVVVDWQELEAEP